MRLAELRDLQLKVQDTILATVHQRQRGPAIIRAAAAAKLAAAREKQAAAEAEAEEKKEPARGEPAAAVLPPLPEFEHSIKTLQELGKTLPSLARQYTDAVPRRRAAPAAPDAASA